MRQLDPEGVQLRRKRRLKRRLYSSKVRTIHKHALHYTTLCMHLQTPYMLSCFFFLLLVQMGRQTRVRVDYHNMAIDMVKSYGNYRGAIRVTSSCIYHCNKICLKRSRRLYPWKAYKTSAGGDTISNGLAYSNPTLLP